jgi:RNA polymerase sigma factor (sigma-70 family)
MGRGGLRAGTGGSRPTPLSIAELYDTHADALLGWFQRRTYSSEVAADLCAETFATAIESQHSYDPERGAPGAWLWGIGRNLLRQYHRTAEVDRRARLRLGITTPTVSNDDLDRVDEQLDAAELATELDARLDELGPALATAVRARVIDGLPYDEVADICGCSVGAARVRVSRGLTALLGLFGSSDRDPEVTP